MEDPGFQSSLGWGKAGFYCKSTNFGLLLYLANCVFSLIFVAANIRSLSDVDRTLHRRETPNLIAAKSLYFEKRQIL